MSADAESWAALLDEFDRRLAQVEAGMVGMPWPAPEGMPPLPAELADRARRILERTTTAAAATDLAAADVRRRMRQVATRRQSHHGRPPVYIDATG